MVNVIKSNDFSLKVENSKGIVIVDFSATWCRPCKMLIPVFDAASNTIGDKAKFFKIDIDENRNIAEKFRISAVPTMIIFKDGVAVENLSGFMPEQNITRKIEAHL